MTLTNGQFKAFYKTSVWQKCRELVLTRDLGICQECLLSGVLMPADTVHHIIHLRDDQTKAFDMDNLVSVCASCHNKLHPEKSAKNRKNKKKNISKKIKFIEIKSNTDIF
jgi:5-methylcytosine-specific restriction endonuclease McrA